MNLFRLSISLFLSLLYTLVYTQQDPFFMPFTGDVYKLPARRVMDSKFGYSEEIYDYPKLGKINWEEIRIKKTTTDFPFPDVDRKDRFGMILDSEMVIKQDGCYAFILSSDDGSVFWIDDKEILNNDHTHKMTSKKDTLFLEAGKYPIKLWYYQGFVNQYGFIFDGFYLGPECLGDKTLSNLPSSNTNGSKKKSKKILLSGQYLFDYDSYTLKEEVTIALDSLIAEIKDVDIKSVTVHGHTCDRGNTDHNIELSQNRADRLVEYFVEQLQRSEITFKAMGHGSSLPIVNNDTEPNREKNRRVEIVIE